MKPEQRHKRLPLMVAPLALGILSACGGSGSGIGIADGGIRGTGSSVGPVSGFGSVFVNGVKFETDGKVTSDDGIDREDQLEEGMILRIDGEWRDDGQGRADSVEYDDTFRGPVANVQQITDPDGVVESVTFAVYGQLISADRQTVFKGTALDTLADDTSVRVSAWRQPDGSYRASYLGVISDDPSDVEIEGRIDQGSLSTSLNEFTINGQKVTYSDISFSNGLSEEDLSELLLVEVEGSITNGVLVADELNEGETRLYRRGDDDDIEFAGPVNTAWNAVTRTFRINGLTVRVDNNTEFDDGLAAEDLVAGLLVQVEGEFQTDGSVLAEEIEAREGNASVRGVIDSNSINFSDNTFLIGGVLVQVTPQTIIADDDSDQRIRLADLNGQYELKVEGIERSGVGDSVFLEATRIEREEGNSDSSQYELTGRLSAISCTASITVFGVPMTITTVQTEFDEDLSCVELQNSVNLGQRPLLEVDYEEVAPGQFFANEIELEDD